MLFKTGLSIIQNGKIPTFLPEEMIQSIFSAGELEPCLAELRNGFQKVGIYQVGTQTHTCFQQFEERFLGKRYFCQLYCGSVNYRMAYILF